METVHQQIQVAMTKRRKSLIFEFWMITSEISFSFCSKIAFEAVGEKQPLEDGFFILNHTYRSN